MKNSTDDNNTMLRVLCPITSVSGSGLQWLIGSPFFSNPPTIVSTFNCLHTVDDNSYSPDYHKESEDIRTLVIRGFYIIGALIVQDDGNVERLAAEAIAASRKIRKLLYGDDERDALDSQGLIGAVMNPNTHNVSFFVEKPGNKLDSVASVYEKQPEKLVWESGCLLQCRVPVKLPIYLPINSTSNAEKIFLHATEGVIAKFKDLQVAYVLEASNKSTEETPRPVILRGIDLDVQSDNDKGRDSDETSQSSVKFLSCAHFSVKSKDIPSVTCVENADTIQVTPFHNSSENALRSSAPAAEYLPATEETIFLLVDFELNVLCYATKDLLLTDAIKKLVIPGLVDQLNATKNTILPNLLKQSTQLRPYHFSPPGILHPVTALYELSYGETELKQVEVRMSLHHRLGLPFDRPLLRVVNALSLNKDCTRKDFVRKGPSLLIDVHIGIPNSGVSGGVVSLVQGSYEYYHYLHDGFDDSGWGCAYRSLQTIISWFRLQHYTAIDVPSHREIQQALVEIGDKDPSFIGSREWIGAIELSFVLDKLLGVSCKVINVRSGAELPEKCRELALHFEKQGTPVMIGGGVLAYTLLGIDYNEASGDCAFLILDPHYTGNDDRKKIVNGGWCGWKKAVDSKGKSFFLHDKFYNLLLPQRPSMV